MRATQNADLRRRFEAVLDELITERQEVQDEIRRLESV